MRNSDDAKRLGRTLFRRARKFPDNDEGTATIEAILWLPLFMVVFTMVADVALIFAGQAQMRRVVQDANRAYSLDRFDSTTDLENAIIASLSNMSANATASAVESGGIITTVASIPANDLDAVGFMAALVNATVTISSQHLIES